MSDDTLPSSLSEDILTLLCFDADTAPVIVNNVKPELFDSVYLKTVATKAIAFYKEFNSPIGIHLYNELEEKLNGEEGALYKKIIKGILNSKEYVKKEYVMNKLNKFILSQRLKLSIIDVSKLLASGKVDEADALLSQIKRNNISLFDPGTMFGHNERTYSFFDSQEENLGIYTGIKELDELGIIPMPKELYMLMGRANSGKSFFLTYLAKSAIKQRKKVLHITLEMSEDRVKGRYFQSLFGVATRKESLQKSNAIFTYNSVGSSLNIDFSEIPKEKLKFFSDADIVSKIKKKMERIKPQLIIKEFPTGSLTIDELKAYLDNLETYYKFIPDIILLDYLDLMAVDSERMRLDLGILGVQLRGIAVERDVAIVTVAQTNNAAEGKRWITRRNIAEDFSKIRYADVFITFNQSEMERENGLARLFIDKSRNEKAGMKILISQNLSIGQFCLSSIKMVESKKYYDKFAKEVIKEE